MDLRCSLLGHEFVEDDIDREREVRGQEEITTLRQFQACRRCGERRLVSEKRHVRAAGEGSDETESEHSIPVSSSSTDGGHADDEDADLVYEGAEVIHGGRQSSADEGTGAYQTRLDETADAAAGRPSDIIEAPVDDGDDSTDEETDAHISIPTAVETEYHCPSCELTESTDDTSLRSGDICPACRDEYIEIREA